MTADITLLTGPAGTGKTHTLLERYRRALVEFRPGSALWLVPNFRSAGKVREQLLGGDLPACLAPNVMTFDQFAEAILRASNWPIRRVTGLMKRHLLEAIVERALAESRLPQFAAIASTRGFLNLLEALISELKRLEIWPERFSECARRERDLRLSELASIYADYQRLLAEHQLYDAEGCFWSARDLLAGQQRRPFERLRWVMVDGFTDFTTTQHEILSILAQRVEQVHISLPLDDDIDREELFRKARSSLQLLGERMPGCRIERQERRDGAGALAHLERQLFLPPHRQQRAPSAGQVTLLRGSSELRELEEIARIVKRLLLDEPTTRPDEIVVVFRNLTASADLVREVFERFGIPHAIETGLPLDRCPAMRALAGMLRLAVEGWPYRQVLATLGSAYYRSSTPDAALALASTERLIHELQIPEGRDDLLRRTDHWAQKKRHEILGEATSDDDLAPHKLQQLQCHEDALRAGPVLHELKARLDLLPPQANCAEWVDALRRFATAVGLFRVIKEQDDQLGQAAFEKLFEALALQGRLERVLGQQSRQLDQRELLDWLADMLQRETAPRVHDEVGRVRVLGAISARNLRVPYLFVAGLSETSFPQPRPARLVSDYEAQHLKEQGVPVTVGADGDHEEMLLFYEVITRATRRIWFSYPALDSKAQELLPSPYLAEVEQLIDFEADDLIDATDPRPIYGCDRAPLSGADWRTAAVWSATEGNVAPLARLIHDPLEATQASNIKAGLHTTLERSRREFGCYEGLLLDPRASAQLRDRYGDEHIWSASRLEKYASCPFQFFLDHVVRLRPLKEIAIDLDPAQRGSWMHAGLARLHRRINEKGPRTPSDLQPAALREHLQLALEEARHGQFDDSPVMAALREIMRITLERWFEQYYEQHRKYDFAHDAYEHFPVPSRFEVSFGLPVKPDDQDSRLQPLVLEVNGQTVRISGRVDRIDIGRHAEQTFFNIIDYKSGQPPRTKKSAFDGTALQLELYAMAVEQVLLADGSLPGAAGYWSISKQGFNQVVAMCEVADGALIEAADWQQRRGQVIDKVLELVAGVQRGQFPVASVDEECTGHCPYHTVCRVNHVRALDKPWPPEGQSP